VGPIPFPPPPRTAARWAKAATTLALLAGMTLPGQTVWAGSLAVNPVRVFLSGAVKSAVLTLQNSGDEPARFQLTLFAWDQNPQGEMVLAPTSDIVFFPPLLTLAPREQRSIRVGTKTPPGAIEKTYRLFVEELPPAEGSAPAGLPGQVRVLTRFGIPIFLQPAKKIGSGRIEGAAIRGGRVSFEVRNTGNVHFMAQAVRVAALGAAGETVFESAIEGWYILTGGTRIYELELPADTCPQVKSVSLEVRISEAAVFTERLDAQGTACHP